MTHVIQPALSVFVGFALAIYGLVHTARHVPARDVFAMFWSALPSVAAVLLFVLGMAAVAIGITLLVRGIQGVRRRIRTVDRIFRDPRVQAYDPDDPESDPTDHPGNPGNPGSPYGYR